MRLGLKPFEKMNNKTQDCLLLVFMLLEYLFRFLYHAGLCMGADWCNVPGDTLRALMCPSNFHNQIATVHMPLKLILYAESCVTENMLNDHFDLGLSDKGPL